MKKTPLAFALFILVFLVSAQGSQAGGEIISYGTISYSVSASTLMVNGSRIIDEYGNEVKLRGFQLGQNDWCYGFGDREPYAPQWVQNNFMPLTQDHLNQIKRWGFNIVALSAFWTSNCWGPSERYEDQPQVYDEEGLNRMLTLIRMADMAGLYVHLEVTVCFDPEWAINGSQPWYGWSTNDYVVFNELDSSGQRGLERFCKYLEWFTQQVAGEPNVVSIEPWHYPFHRQNENNLDSERTSEFFNDVVPAMINSVRKHTNKIIVINPPTQGHFDYNDHPGPFTDSNIVYGTGGYGYHKIASKADSPAWDYDINNINAPHHSAWDFRDKYDVPIMSTEGPGITQHPALTYGRPLRQDRVDLYEALLTLMDDLSGWIVWKYSGPGNSWGVLENENPNDPASEGQIIQILKIHIPS